MYVYKYFLQGLLAHILKTGVERFLWGLLAHILKTGGERFLWGLLAHILKTGGPVNPIIILQRQFDLTKRIFYFHRKTIKCMYSV
jgi:hypothetical protein